MSDLSYYQKNRERILQRRKELYAKNKEKENLYHKQYRIKNRQLINQKQRERYANDEKYNQYKKEQSKKVYAMKKSNPV
tara:strand:- start:161 stop:397 length:237 start_codon:yes stop_codon:yes gene_type:complete